MTDISEKQRAFNDAQDKFLTLKNKIQDEKWEAKRKVEAEIDERYKDERRQLYIAFSHAQNALAAEKDNKAQHPWEGHFVTAMRRPNSNWRFRPEPVVGIVEVVRSDTVFAKNTARYNTPNVGNVIVRRVKKDGTKSLKIWDNYYNGDLKDWALVKG